MEYDQDFVDTINEYCNRHHGQLIYPSVFKIIEKFDGIVDDNYTIDANTPYWQLLIWSHFILSNYVDAYATEEESDIVMDIDPSNDLIKDSYYSPLTRATWRENIIKGIDITKRHNQITKDILSL